MKLLFILLMMLIVIAAPAQTIFKLPGIWEGKLTAGISLRLVFIFSKDSTGKLSGTLTSPDQGNKSITCSGVELKKDSIFINVQGIKATYAGNFTDDSTITGKFTQGQSFDLILKKVLNISVLRRPQNPHPPFPYISEDVEYDNAGKTLHYGATITIPKGKGPFPAVLLITGSGPQNRDEEIFEHRPFAVIADHLTRQGFVVLRVDDRGVDKSSGNFATATTADFAADAKVSLDYLKGRKEVDAKRLGMLGHSEGGMIAPMVASDRDDISFIILLAAPGEKITRLLQEQNVALLTSSGLNKEAAEDYGKLFSSMVAAVINQKNTNEANTNLNTVINEWKKNTSNTIVTATTGITNDSTQQRFVHSFTASLTAPWFRYFLQLDPEPYLVKLRCRVLALNGEKDLQVSSASNLAGINSALKRSKSPSFEVKEIAGLNHLFQHCKKCTVNEYGELEETFSPEVLNIISAWLIKNVK